MTSTAEIAFEITVAVATPATPMPNPATKTMFSTMFTRPEMMRTMSGLVESPRARRMDDPKSYSRRKGIVRK